MSLKKIVYYIPLALVPVWALTLIYADLKDNYSFAFTCITCFLFGHMIGIDNAANWMYKSLMGREATELKKSELRGKVLK